MAMEQRGNGGAQVEKLPVAPAREAVLRRRRCLLRPTDRGAQPGGDALAQRSARDLAACRGGLTHQKVYGRLVPN
jgi:hypothetical protein